MRYLLDTNVCITFISQSNPALNQRFSIVHARDKIVCSIVRAELYYGVYKSQRPHDNLLKIDSFLAHLPSLPFDDYAARAYGSCAPTWKAEERPSAATIFRSPPLPCPITLHW